MAGRLQRCRPRVSLPHPVAAIELQVRESIDLTGRPTDLDFLDSILSQAEMKSRIGSR